MSINLKNYQSTAPQNQFKKDEPTENFFDFLNKDIQLFGNQLSMKKKEAFYAELEVLLKAGLDLKTALDLVEEGQEKPKDKALFAQINESVTRGAALSNAMKTTDKFSNYEVFSIQIAEESGKLAPILADLSAYFARNLQYRRLLTSALSYPLLVIFVAFGAMAFLLTFLVPLFGDIYARLDQELPSITLVIIRLSNLMQAYLSSILLGCGMIVIILYFQKKKIWFRKISTALLIRMPIIGGLIQQIYLARFAQAIAFLLAARVPLLNALDLIKKMVGFYPIESSLDQISADILKGKALYQGMENFSIYPRRMISLIKVGEEANHLEEMFAKLASQYNEDVEQRTKMIGSLIEPILIVFLALVVGVVLVSMYLPIFKLVSNFGV